MVFVFQTFSLARAPPSINPLPGVVWQFVQRPGTARDRESFEEEPSVTLGEDAFVEEGENPAIRPAANEPSKPLFQQYDGFRDLIVVKCVPA